jgi:hypothetical protein
VQCVVFGFLDHNNWAVESLRVVANKCCEVSFVTKVHFITLFCCTKQDFFLSKNVFLSVFIYTGCFTGLVHGLQIDLDESLGHVEPKNHSISLPFEVLQNCPVCQKVPR